jgi:MinD-like ATPase involved in chromosome partitioning or flagellar assembly
MTTPSPPGSVVTFYSWKGGVGRTMVLANVAVQLARMGSTVLVVDWDLEAPGLERYFINLDQSSAANPTGLMGLLCEASDRGDATSSDQDWRDRLVLIQVPQAQPTPSMQIPPAPSPIHFLPSGYGSEDYAKRLSDFSWSKFFADFRGGEWLEALRDQWSESYDFVLIDSRTGLTDSGGVCTIQMPHILVLVFTANDQSVEGGLRVVAAAQRERRDFGYDRGPLVVIPVLSRWEGEKEVDIGEQWMKRFDIDLVPLTAPWLPKDFSPRQFLEKTRVPHVARFTFGEPLPVLTHSLSDPGLPGLYFDTIAQLILFQLSNVGTVIDPAYIDKQYRETISEVSRLRATDPASAKAVPIFVSYRILDDEAPPSRGNDRGFVRYLIRQVRYDLTQLGVSDAVVWVDRAQIEVGDTWSDEIFGAVNAAELFIVILSKNYIASSWCERELSTIASRISKLDLPQRRILRVDKHRVPENLTPELLREVEAVQFYREDRETNSVDEYFWRGKVVLMEEYEEAVHELALAICQQVDELSPRVREVQLQSKPRDVPAANGRVVFVAKPAGDMLSAYRSLVEELQGAGYRVTPDSDKDLIGEKAWSAVVEALAEAEASVHLLGERTGGRQGGLDLDLVSMQLAAAADEARKKPGFERMIWAPTTMLSGTSVKVVRRDPLSIVNRFGELLPTDQIDGDTASRFTEFVLQRLGRHHWNSRFGVTS